MSGGIWASSALVPWYHPRTWWIVAYRIAKGLNWCCGGRSGDEHEHWEGCQRRTPTEEGNRG
jgi:hypothetical protein